MRSRKQEAKANDGQLAAALNVGEQAVKRGQTKPYTPALLNKTERDARRMAAKGAPVNPDVCA